MKNFLMVLGLFLMSLKIVFMKSENKLATASAYTNEVKSHSLKNDEIKKSVTTIGLDNVNEFKILNTINKKVILSESETKLKDTLLKKEEVVSKVLSILNEVEQVNIASDEDRFRTLDVVYLGLKSADEGVRNFYIETAKQLLNKKIDQSVLSNAKLHKKMNGDRVELAIVLSMISKLSLSEFKNSDNLTYFNQAKKMQKLYEVAI